MMPEEICDKRNRLSKNKRMDKDKAVNKIIRDLRQTGIIEEENIGIIRMHLGFLYTAGWDEGHHKSIYYNNKEVYQCDKDGHILNSYKSATDAAKSLNCTRETIYIALAEKRMTRKGHYWKHKEEII